jgi:hypothetical protein
MRCRKENYLGLTVTILATRKGNEVMMKPGCVGVWREYGVRRSVCVGVFGTDLPPVAVKMFSR